jgi:hypothetical protein
MTREGEITHEAIVAAIADTDKGRSRDGYYISALADHENGFKEGFIEGAKWADEHPNWISLKDMKPPLMERVFLYAEGWHEPSIGRLMIVGGKEVYLDEDFSKVIVDEISLWMPFPKASKKGGKHGK